MSKFSKKKLVFIILTILLTLIFLGFLIYMIVNGKYIHALALFSSTCLMLSGAMGMMDFME